MTEGEFQVSVDFDGVLFSRIPIQAAAFKPSRTSSKFKPKQTQLTRKERLVDESPISLKEKVDIWRHSLIHVKPAAAEMVLAMDTGVLVGNTGRSNHRVMIDITMRKLEEAGSGRYF